VAPLERVAKAELKRGKDIPLKIVEISSKIPFLSLTRHFHCVFLSYNLANFSIFAVL
jgi:hypothetical protein